MILTILQSKCLWANSKNLLHASHNTEVFGFVFIFLVFALRHHLLVEINSCFEKSFVSALLEVF